MRYKEVIGIPEDEATPTWFKASLVIIALFFAMILFFAFTVRVDAGQACAKLKFGEVVGRVGPGLHLRIPIVNRFACLNGREQTLDLLMANSDGSLPASDATYTDVSVSGKSITGVSYEATLSLRYVLPVDRVNDLYSQVGRTDEVIFQKSVLTPTRALTRQVLNTHTADELYFGNLASISDEVRAQIEPEMSKSGLILTFFAIKEIDFEDTYENRIKEKNAEVENAKLKELQQRTAEEEAARLKIEAEGQAAAVKARAQGEADAVRVLADAEKYELDQRNAALTENPELIEWERIKTIQTADVIYLPSDVLPILPIEPSPTSTATP